MRKPVFCICENKDADQLCGNRIADQRLCFRYTDSTIPLLPKSENSSLLPSSVAVQPGLCGTWSETPKTGFLTTRLHNTVNQIIFVAINFRIFVFMGIFTAIYFRGLQNWTMQEQCTVCLRGYFRTNLFLQVLLSRKNKLLAKINRFTYYNVHDV